MLGTYNSCYPAFNITYIARKLLPGYPNTPAAVLLVYLSGLSLPVAVLTAEVVQLMVILSMLTMVFAAKGIVWL